MTDTPRVVFLGTPDVAVPSLDAVAADFDVRLVITQPDRPRGRSKRPQPPPVKARAEELGLAVAQPERSGEIAGMLDAAGPLDLAVLVAFGQLIRPEALNVPRRGFLNVHFSILPRWRGAAPVQRAILAGDERVGVTIMALDAGLDTGPTVATWSTGLAPTENAGDVLDRMAVRGAELVQQVVGPYLGGRLIATPQPQAGTVAPKITGDDRMIDWTASAVDCVRRVRALAPRPGATTRLGGEPFKVLAAEAVSGRAAPGTVDGVSVGTGSGLVRLVVVQPAGRTPMSAEDWRRGLGDRVTEFG